MLSLAAASCAAELLTNRSFELPVAPSNGNNFYATIPNWTLVPSPVVAQPANIVVPTTAYLNNPQATPTGGGRQYFDMNSTGGAVRQTLTLSTAGIASMSCWFSVRDFPQNQSNFFVRLRNSAGTIIFSGTSSFASTDPIGLWKQVVVNEMSLAAGTYTFEVFLDNYINIDLASFDFGPAAPRMQIQKFHDRTAPVVLGETITYTYRVKNVGNVTINNVGVSDVHNGYGVDPVPGGETMFADAVPVGDSSNTVLNNGIWESLKPGDEVKFTGTYVVVQSDIDFLW
jgi:uncharacterized repeat protein (TIGR01451 family)